MSSNYLVGISLTLGGCSYDAIAGTPERVPPLQLTLGDGTLQAGEPPRSRAALNSLTRLAESYNIHLETPIVAEQLLRFCGTATVRGCVS